MLVTIPILLAYTARADGSEPDDDVLYQYGTAVGAAIVYAFMLLLVLWIAGFDRRLLALVRPRVTWFRTLGLSAAVFVGSFLVIAILEQFLHGGEEQGLTPDGWRPEHAGAYAANFVVIAVVAPIVEELTFRGLGYSLLESFGPWIAIGITGLVFGLQHGLVQGLPELVLFGCALAWLRWKTGSVYPGIVLHSLFNSFALIAAVLS